MSATTCARSGGAYLFRCTKDQDLYWPLAQMQRDLDEIASGAIPTNVTVSSRNPLKGKS